MTGRHHYSLPGASFLKPRGSVKAQTQQQKAAPANNVPSSSRETRQSTSRAYHSQEAVAENTPLRPPSAAAYRSQHSNTGVNGFHASNSTRQASVQRPTTTPPASSSRTRLDVPDSRGYFAKMFSRKQTTPTPGQASEKAKNSHKHHRTSVAPTVPPQAPYPSGPSASRTSFDAQPQRDSDREDRKKQRAKDDRVAAERTKEERERRRAEYAAYKARLEEIEREHASGTRASHMDRAVPRPSQEDRRKEYESDNARRRPQPQSMAHHSQKQEARQSQYLHYLQTPASLGYRVMTPARNGQQMFAQQPAARPPGVPVQPSSSSHSTSASNQAQPSHSALYSTRMDPTGNPNPVSTSTPFAVSDPAPVLPPKGNSASHQASIHPLSQHASQQSHFTPPGLTTLPSYQSSGPDYRQRLDKEAAEREAMPSHEPERVETERETVFKRRESERDVAEREAPRERARDRETEKRRDAEREAAERDLELQRQSERERQRGLDREQRRVRRAERERMKELERAEHERRKQREREERERQKQIERAERERLKALEQAELEKQEEERLRWERKEKERVERERLRAEREAERAERERLRDKAERERERAARSTTKHRSHRDKSQTMPTNTLLGATSGSDTDRLMPTKKDARRRSQSFSTVPQDLHLHAAPSTGYRREPREHLQESPGNHIPAVKKDPHQSSPFQYEPAETFHTSTTTFPNPPSRTDITNARSISAVALPTQSQENTPPRARDRGQSDPSLPAETRAHFDPSGPGHQAHSEDPQGKLVSIYASQGPSDRFAYRPSQKITAGQSTMEQQFVKPPTTTSKGFEDYPRPSLEHESRRVSVLQPNSTPPKLAPPTPQDEPASIAHETSANQIAAFYARHSEVPTSTSIMPASKQARSDAAQSGPSKVSPAANASSFSLQTAYSMPQEQTQDRLQPAIVGANTPHRAGFSSYSQNVPGQGKELLRAPTDNQQVALVSRVPSNNSTRSPSRKTAQLPSGSDTLQGEPVSRTASDASRSSGHCHSSASHGHLQLNPVSSQQLYPPTETVTPSPMYPSTLNTSHTSRHRHESVTNLHQQAVPHSHTHTHTHSQSLPQQYVYNTSRDDVHHSRQDSLPNTRPTAHIPASDVSHHQYPASQATAAPSKATYNPSTNQPAIAQSNSSLPPSTPDAKPPVRPPVISNSLSTYSAAVANLPPLSQVSSTMLSHPQSTLSQNPPYSSSTRNHIPAYLPQRYQTATTPLKPVFPPPGTSDPSDTTRPPFPRSSRRPVYVTTTRSSGPFVDESPSSTGGGVSLDSPPPVQPQPSEQSGQPANRRPDSHLGPLTKSTHGRNQPQSSAENRSSSQPPSDDIPPLTPSSSSHESNEEILMTPASLNQARTRVDVRQPSDSSQRSEKKKGGLLKTLFRSSSTKSAKEKDRSEQEFRKQLLGSQRDQRTETVNKLGSTRPPSIMITLEADPNTVNAESTGQDQSKQQLRVPKPVPPPISIPPPESFPYRLFSRSRRHRTMSSASLEAVDGTANNTVVGSPTSSRRSPTPSGPMTPPVRDPMEATGAWRNNEDVFLDPGSQRRRRPGVTFDLKDNSDGQKDGARYRRSRQHRPRRDSLR